MSSGRRCPAANARADAREVGQGLVEFALVGGLFFALLFSVMNAGFFLYGRNAVQHAADVGVAALAAEGNCQDPTACPPNADGVAISRMGSAGLTTTPLISITEIDIWHELQSGSSFVDDTTGCSGGPCENRYDVHGNVLNSGGTMPWPPSTRNVGNTPDFAKLVITYKYSLLVGTTSFTLSTNNLFRLEPQT